MVFGSNENIQICFRIVDLFWAKTVELIDSIVLDSTKANYTWPLKKTANMDGEITLGGLHMIHERSRLKICGPIMAQGGIENFQYLNFSYCIQTKLQFWPLFKSELLPFVGFISIFVFLSKWPKHQKISRYFLAKWGQLIFFVSGHFDLKTKDPRMNRTSLHTALMTKSDRKAAQRVVW